MNKKNVYLFQPQYYNIANNKIHYWLPYSVGCIWSYASQFLDITENFKLDRLFFKRDRFDHVLEMLDSPAVCGFSCYVWNEQYCLNLAKIIKEKWPNCIIVFGGEQVSTHYKNYDFIDTIIMYEGEENFVELLRCVLDNKEIPKDWLKRRLNELNMPSPYSSGLFDDIIKENPDVCWNMAFETNRGCPFSCTFCNWGSLTQSKIKKFNLDRIEADLKWCVGKPITYIAMADANFGILKERDLEIAKLFRKYADHKESNLEAINIQYTKNSNETVFEIAKTVKNLSKGITVSMQSMNPDTSKAIKRVNLDLDNLSLVNSLAEKYGVTTYTELILGLPLETKESWKKGFSELLESGQHYSIEVWFGQVLKNSELGSDESREKYGIETINAIDYYLGIEGVDEEPISEYIEVINKTNTMTTEEMTECFMFSWAIINFHISGYSQIIADYLHNVHHVSYNTFYTEFINTLTNSETILSTHYKELYVGAYTFLTTGKIDQNKFTGSGHNLLHSSREFIYQNKEQIFNLFFEVAKKLCKNIELDIYNLQKQIIYDSNTNYPVIIYNDYNPISRTKQERIKIKIDSELKILDNYALDYNLRRQNFIKNIIRIEN